MNIYTALAELDGAPRDSLSDAQIVSAGLSGASARAIETLDLFAGFLGTAAGSLALTLSARGGIYVAGGIAPRIADSLAGSIFRQRFEDMGRFSSYLSGVPTYLITHPFPAFVGLRTVLGR